MSSLHPKERFISIKETHAADGTTTWTIGFRKHHESYKIYEYKLKPGGRCKILRDPEANPARAEELFRLIHELRTNGFF